MSHKSSVCLFSVASTNGRVGGVVGNSLKERRCLYRRVIIYFELYIKLKIQVDAVVNKKKIDNINSVYGCKTKCTILE